MSPDARADLSTLTLSVIIVNYRAAHLVCENMPALLDEVSGFASADIIVVDNASPGEDRRQLTGLVAANEQVRLILAEKNGGFAYGNNRGLEVAEKTDLYFFLNPDARPRPGALRQMAETLLSREGAGVVGPLLVNEAGEHRASVFNRFEPLQEYSAGGGVASGLLRTRPRVAPLATDEVKVADWIPGAAMLVKGEVIELVGGMDEDYFLYFEETDWLEQIGLAGFCIYADGGAVVEHIEGVSTGVVGGKVQRSDLPPYWYQSWRRFWVKNRTRGDTLLAALLFAAGIATGSIKRRLKKQQGGSGPTLKRFVKLCLLPILRGDPL